MDYRLGRSRVSALTWIRIFARLMLGPITPERIQCSQTTNKDGSLPVLVRLSNDMVFTPNKLKDDREYSRSTGRGLGRSET